MSFTPWEEVLFFFFFIITFFKVHFSGAVSDVAAGTLLGGAGWAGSGAQNLSWLLQGVICIHWK